MADKIFIVKMEVRAKNMKVALDKVGEGMVYSIEESNVVPVNNNSIGFQINESHKRPKKS